MNDKTKSNETIDQSTAKQPNVAINAQYVRDLSFESPGAPTSLTKIKTPPKIDLSLDIKVNNLHGDSYEVVIEMSAKATTEHETLFIAELEYGGLFTLSNIENEQQKEQILLIYCPSLLFPFARSIIADATRDGGFQPLMINPVDFGALYISQKNKQASNGSTNSKLD